MKIEDYTLEDICEKINIQSHLSDLQSGKKTQIKSALTTLSSIVSITKRKDALYALLGYYLLEINSTEEIEKFFDLTKNTNSIDLYRLILQDISKHKNIFRKKLFIDDFLRNLSGVTMHAKDEELNKIKEIIQKSEWGEKLKKSFSGQLEVLIGKLFT